MTGQILSVSAAGGFQLTGSYANGILTGGTAKIENMRFDLANKRIYADLSGTRSAFRTGAAVDFNLPDTVLWNVADVTGPNAFNSAALFAVNPVQALQAAGYSVTKNSDHLDIQGQYTLSGLSITEQGSTS